MAGYLPPTGHDYSQASADAIGRAIFNYSQILVMVTEIVASQAVGGLVSQAQISAVVTAAQTNSLQLPKPTTTVDGVTYNWTEYQTMIGTQIEQLRKVQILLYGPWMINVYAR